MYDIWIEVVLALENKQYLLRNKVKNGTSIKEALLQTDLMKKFPQYFKTFEVGIFGNKVSEDYLLKEGDRIEIYRLLKIDPKQNRRIRSEKKR